MKDRSNDEHHCHHPGCSEHQTLSPPQLIDTDNKEYGSGDDLHGTVHAGGEERRVSFGDADRLENLRCVVADTVGAGELLPEHDAEAGEETHPVTRG